LARVIENPVELILSEARAIAMRDGLANLSIRNVAKACGIAPGTIYNYFPSKDDLLMALLEDFWGQVFRDVSTEVYQAETFTEAVIKLRIFLTGHVDRFKSDWLSQLSNMEQTEQLTCKTKKDHEAAPLVSLLEALHEHFEATLPIQDQDAGMRSKTAQFLNYVLMGTLNHQIEPAYFDGLVNQLYTPTL
jgi:AcrR family transcriptional regulator